MYVQIGFRLQKIQDSSKITQRFEPFAYILTNFHQHLHYQAGFDLAVECRAYLGIGIGYMSIQSDVKLHKPKMAAPKWEYFVYLNDNAKTSIVRPLIS